jgi:hypothetical protein
MRRIALMGVLLALTAIAVAPVAAKQGAPGAPPPDVLKGSKVPTAYTDDVLCQYAPNFFDVWVEGTDTYTITIYYNPDTSVSKITFNDNFQGTVSANGVTLRKQAAGNTVYDYNAGIDTFKGLAAKYQPFNGGKPISVDAGYISFDIDGVVKEAGPHPLFDGPGNDAVCDALSGA